jgi:TPR repeat protein
MNYDEAFKWYARAAEQGSSDAQDWLGNLYYSGLGVKQDYNAAFEWYSRSAKQGNTYAYYYLGFCYREGQGVVMSIPWREYPYRYAFLLHVCGL